MGCGPSAVLEKTPCSEEDRKPVQEQTEGRAVSPSEGGSHRDPESCKDKGIFFFLKQRRFLAKAAQQS